MVVLLKENSVKALNVFSSNRDRSNCVINIHTSDTYYIAHNTYFSVGTIVD